MTEQEIEALCEMLPSTYEALICAGYHQCGKDVLQALTAIRQLQQPWRGMESAPDNTAVLVRIPGMDYYGNNGVYAAMRVNMGTGPRWMTFGWAIGRDCSAECQPTEWMPMPPTHPTGDRAMTRWPAMMLRKTAAAYVELSEAARTGQ